MANRGLSARVPAIFLAALHFTGSQDLIKKTYLPRNREDEKIRAIIADRATPHGYQPVAWFRADECGIDSFTDIVLLIKSRVEISANMASAIERRILSLRECGARIDKNSSNFEWKKFPGVGNGLHFVGCLTTNLNGLEVTSGIQTTPSPDRVFGHLLATQGIQDPAWFASAENLTEGPIVGRLTLVSAPLNSALNSLKSLEEQQPQRSRGRPNIWKKQLPEFEIFMLDENFTTITAAVKGWNTKHPRNRITAQQVYQARRISRRLNQP